MNDTAQDFRRIERAIGYIERRFREQPSLEEIARSTGLAPHHFARVFRRWAGISPKQFLQRLTVEAAKDALARDASVLQAALDAGLSGPGRLHDLCVALEAVTPGEFKSRGRSIVFRYGTAATPFGDATVALRDDGIAFLGFADAAGQVEGWDEFRRHWSAAEFRPDRVAAARVGELVGGAVPRRDEPLRLWVHGTNFQMQVWQALLRIARDGTTTYGEIAKHIGRPEASRAVGSAVGANPVAWLIPCHHVLRANGALGGYRWGVERKRAMLAWEVCHSGAAS